MRASLKIGAKWETLELPADPEQLSKWLTAHDGEQAVVSDDGSGVFYCGRVEEFNLYETKGKPVKMFCDLDRMLYENQTEIQKIFSDVNAVFPGSSLESLSLSS